MRAVPAAPRARDLRSALPPLLLAFCCAAPAARAGSIAAPAARDLERGVRVHRLANGMTFLLLERRQAPIFSGVVRFRVGGMDEDPGRSGLAHLFEHLAFKGTTRIGVRDPAREEEILREVEERLSELEAERGEPQSEPARVKSLEERLAALEQEHRRLLVPNEFTEIYSAHGAVGLNASTDKDLTSYYVSLPANRLELWCLMESERLRDGVLRGFYTERDVVMEERRLRVETQPLGSLYEALLRAAYGDGPYGLPTVGLMEDLKRLRAPQALEFRRRHYRPENAVAALVGDFRTDEALQLIERYFGDWRGDPAGEGGPAPAPVAAGPPPSGPAVRTADAGVAAGGGAPRPLRVDVEFASEPYLLVAFDKPIHPHPDAVTFDVLSDLLTGGRTSRLYRTLVVERQLALDLFAFEGPGQRRDNLFILGLIPQAPHGVAEVEAALLNELAELARSPVPEREIEKVRNRFQASFLRDLTSNSGLARQLSYYQILLGDWREMLRLVERAGRVGRAEVQAAARRYLAPDRRVAAAIVPKRPAGPAPGAGAGEGR